MCHFCLLTRVQEKIKQKRMEKAEQEKKDQIQREKLRRAAGKDMSQVKQKYERIRSKKFRETLKIWKISNQISLFIFPPRNYGVHLRVPNKRNKSTTFHVSSFEPFVEFVVIAWLFCVSEWKSKK